jgi:hypothetical protein
MRVLVVFTLGALVAGCGAPAAPEPAFWRPWYDPAPAAGGDSPPAIPPTGGVGGVGGGAGECGLAVTVTTSSTDGTYAPNNIGAIWVADGAGHFVQSLRVWANRRIEHLDRWDHDTAVAGSPGSVVDAVTSATLPGHGVRTAAWSCRDRNGAPAPDGAYQVCFELTESNSAGPIDCVPFQKGAAPLTLTPPDRPTFHARQLTITPGSGS